MEHGLIAAILAATIVAGTPLIFAALGELVTERSGVLNLGVEGMMAVGAVAGFVATFQTGSAVVGMLAGMAAGALVSAIFAVLVLTLLANQVAAGLALSIFGTGLAAFVGKPWEAASLTTSSASGIGASSDFPVIRTLSDLPIIGPVLFEQQWPVYVSWLLLAGVAWFLFRSRAGLVLRAVGESPESAHAIGHPVLAVRYAATLFGGAMSGMGGAFLSVFYTPMWAEGMVSGRGWIALALVVFATWRPLRVAGGAYLFGGAMVAQLFLQGSGAGIAIPTQFLTALPYVATIVVLVLISRNPNTIRLNAPASLGQRYRPDA
ncbi:MAG: ABC transporter permease [Gammaproteobacteria bacterium]